MTDKPYEISWHQFQQDIELLTFKIRKYKTYQPCFWAVERDGMIPAVALSHQFGTSRVRTILKEEEEQYLRPRHVDDIIIDDIYDKGNTFKELRERYPEVTIACLYVKMSPSEKYPPAYLKLENFIFGTIIQTDGYIYTPWEVKDG